MSVVKKTGAKSSPMVIEVVRKCRETIALIDTILRTEPLEPEIRSMLIELKNTLQIFVKDLEKPVETVEKMKRFEELYRKGKEGFSKIVMETLSKEEVE